MEDCPKLGWTTTYGMGLTRFLRDLGFGGYFQIYEIIGGFEDFVFLDVFGYRVRHRLRAPNVRKGEYLYVGVCQSQ